MGLITTTKTTPDNPTGLMDEDTPGLVKSSQVVENDDEMVVAVEYRLHGELVHRSVHVELKKWPAGMEGFGAALQ